MKSTEVLGAFLAGADPTSEGTAFFGVVGIEREFRAAQRSGPWFYGDNAFFDAGRGRFFRFARNAFQVSTPQRPDLARLKALGVRVRGWARGRHVLVVEQSAHFLGLSGAPPNWLQSVTEALSDFTDRPIKIRRWSRDKAGAASGLQADLVGAHALVTHTSAAANEALLAGVPAFVTGPCAATPMASGPLIEIERPRRPDGREEWAAGLAGAQWTLEELRSGMAWRHFCG
jgi:hypothetical protein